MRSLRLFVIIAGLTALLGHTAAAQVLYGTLVGNVTDPSQGAVAGANVTLSSKETGLTKDTVVLLTAGFGLDTPDSPT